ncbi:putative serine/threonine protein kinase [Trypanosoma rangeli]|uniref:Putative serine/threonine protein kinase n=1 Tax=Trypanosoma rangeli TaxID=5698 RepID=A0A422NZ37_TRYRA|nr:putative serine/threonine protein kinase [Trypanosoma rangeli]RNF10704.1 putative serine/threonine protein kinase [Trypanosoma rangeli]|eukprot:RNF10704.1 putative serine/threonine protein kinase [Trypanosoma rangeli]
MRQPTVAFLLAFFTLLVCREHLREYFYTLNREALGARIKRVDSTTLYTNTRVEIWEMLRKKVLGIGASSATILVQDTVSNGELRVLKRINVSSWKPSDVTETHETYKALLNAQVVYMAKLHMVMLQGSFLNTVTTYYARGDLEAYIEDGSRNPFDEATTVRWLLVIARVVEQVHQLRGGCFYGLSLDRIFFADDALEVRVGLPMPRLLYFKWLSDREALGAAVEREYPPEAVNEHRYEANVSDVWHLGLVGMKLLSAHTSYFSRSTKLRSIITSMMEPSAQRRLTLAEVVWELTKLVGGDNVPQLPEALVGPTSPRHFTAAVSCGMTAQATAPSTDNSTADEANEKNGNNFSYELPAQCEVLRTPNTTARGARARLHSNWHRRAMEQFEELQRLNASSPGRSGACSPTLRRSRSLSSGAGTPCLRSSRNTAATPPASRMLKTPARFTERNSRDSFDNAATRSRTATDMVQNMLREQEKEQQRREALRQEQKARRWKQQEKDREALNVHQNHLDNMKKIRSNLDKETKHDIRRHIKNWKKQRALLPNGNVIVNKEDGVAVFAPKHRPPPALEVSLTKDHEKDLAAITTLDSERSKRIVPISTFTSSRRPASVPVGSHLSPPRVVPSRCAAIYHESGVGPRTPKTRAMLVSTPPPLSSALTSNDAFSTTSPKTTNHGSLIFPTGKELVGRSPVSLSSADLFDFPLAQRSNEVVQYSPRSNGRAREGSLLSSLDASVTNLKNSLAKLLANHDRYVEVIDVVNAFVVRPEADRCNPNLNVAFMNTLRNLLDNEQQFLAAAPLCAQLMALQGFLKRPTLVKKRDSRASESSVCHDE